jgi:minor histocompatibility antigen H13
MIEWGILVAYVGILVMALVPIWIGSHQSLEQKAVETMKAKDAYMFPIVGSCVLFGLYLLFKLFSKEYINMLLTAYFLFFGVMAVAATLRPFIAPLFSKSLQNEKPKTFSLFSVAFEWTVIDIFALVLGVGIGAWYVLTKHWIANNILGLAFSIQGIALLSLGSFQIGCILLCGLFVYDIFWVFGTDVMVTVAKSFDAPVKLLWPKDLFAEQLHFSMLGLGDIVIPGIFIALMLRFDALRARKQKVKKNFSKPYFMFTYVGYILGMATTIGVMHVFQAAQPALLYLVPYCIGSSLFAALLLGEVKELIFFSEEKPEKTKDHQEGGGKKKHSGSKKASKKQPKEGKKKASADAGGEKVKKTAPVDAEKKQKKQSKANKPAKKQATKAN